MFKSRFVPWGTLAPTDIPTNQFWLDVGGRNRGNVFDHHTDDGDSQCTVDLVIERFKGGYIRRTCQDIEFVTHIQPDIDGICSCWALNSLLEGRWIELPSWLYRLANRVRSHDQGLENDIDVNKDWILWLSLEISLLGADDSKRVMRGFEVFDEIAVKLESGFSIFEMLFEPSEQAKNRMQSEKRKFEADLLIGNLTEVEVPQRSSGDAKIIDALFIENPSSSLFKHFVRREKSTSPRGLGFQLLCVSKRHELEDGQPPRWRHIISLPGNGSGTLKGLGQHLEEMERHFEASVRTPLLNGRRRVPLGEGRFGGDIESPWYDGRGHGYAIVDSPAVEYKGQKICASLIPPSEVKVAIFRLKELAGSFDNQ